MKPAHIAVAVVAALTFTGCANGSQQEASAPTTASTPTPSAPAAEPRTTEAAQAAAQLEFDLYSAGDWGGAWDLWTAAGQKAISRADYVKYHSTCHTMTGLLFEITGTRLEGKDRAVVTYKRAIIAGAGEMRYERAAWRWQPDAEDMKGYRAGVDAMVAKTRKTGWCAKEK